MFTPPLFVASDPDAQLPLVGPRRPRQAGRALDRAVGERIASQARTSDVAWVAARLAAHRDEILERWLDAAAAQPFHAGRREHAVADHIPALFDALVALLRRHAPPGAPGSATGPALDDPAVLKAAHEHARERIDEGLEATDVLIEFRLLRQEIGRELHARPGLLAAMGPAVDVLEDVLGAQLLLNDALDSAALLALSALNQHEDEIQRVQRTSEQEREAFLAAVTHDLKNPLTAIKGVVQILQRQAVRGQVSPEGLLERLRRVDESAGRMAAQINELMDVVRLRAGEPLQLKREPVDLVALVRRTAATHQAGTQAHTVRLEIALPALVGEWDIARIERVLDNVVGNALKFSPRGGEVLVRVTAQGRGRRRAAVVTVRDQGIGIPAADLPHVFEWFKRGSNAAGRVSGTGIGLAAVRQIVEQHGGSVAVESEEGKGSTFTIRLPLQPPAERQAQ